MKSKTHRGVSKEQWFEAGLEILTNDCVAALTIEGLARTLGITKAGFYWHFKDRDDLLGQMLDYWAYQHTEVLRSNAEVIALEPKQRLVKIAETIVDYSLTKYELAVYQWALHEPEVARLTRKVYRRRYDFVNRAFAELGFEGEDLELRTMTFVCFYTWEIVMFRDISHKRRRAQIVKRIELLTRK